MQRKQWHTCAGKLLLIGVLGAVLGACEKQQEASGPAEQIGKQIDQVLEKANEHAQTLTGKAQETVKDSTSTAGKKIDEAVDDAKSKAKELAAKAGEKIESAGKAIQQAGQDAQK